MCIERKNGLPDTPWHVGYTKKEESDPRRHKARCAYFRGTHCACGNNCCYMTRCAGSSHCKDYTELPDIYMANKEKEQEKFEFTVRDQLSSFQNRKRIEKVMHYGKYYYKIYFSEEETLMVPYSPHMSKGELKEYIRRYKEMRRSR